MRDIDRGSQLNDNNLVPVPPPLAHLVALDRP